MIKRGTPLLILCAVFFISTAGCIGTSVKPGERGLVWHPLTAGLEKEPLKDGFYWKWPWNDVYRYDVRWQSYSENVDAWSADDLQIRQSGDYSAAQSGRSLQLGSDSGQRLLRARCQT